MAKENISPQSLLQRQIIQLKQQYLEEVSIRESESREIKLSLSNASLQGFKLDTSLTKFVDETKYEVEELKFQLEEVNKKASSELNRLEELLSEINV